jgi:MFS family permease
MVPPLLPLFAHEFALSPVEAGLVNTVYGIGRLGASYPATWLRARHGTRTALFAGIGALIAGTVGCGLAPGFALFLAARLMMGVGASAAFLAIFAELLEATPAAWRGRTANAFEALAILSLAVGGLLAAALAGRWGWRAAFLAAGPFLLVTLPFRPLIAPAAGRHPVMAGRSGTARDLARLLPVYAACCALAGTWAGLWTTLIPLLGSGAYGLSSPALGAALGAGYVAEVAGLVTVGLVIDRVRREPVFLGGALTVTAGGLVLASGRTEAVFVGGLVLVGAGFAMWMIPATVLADRIGIPIPPRYLAVYRIVMDGGMIVGPLLLGVIAQLGGDRLAVGVAGTFLVAGALALARRPRL